MEKIDLTNYEAYFLDYMEGTLSAEEKHDLIAFLKQHPKLRAEMEADFGMVQLQPEKTIVFDQKEALKVDEDAMILTPDTIDDYIIASVEGQLTEAHQHELNAYIEKNNLQKTVGYYKATVLKPDTTEVFEDKEKLKVKTGVVISMPWVARVASIAAVGAILITVAMNWNGSSTTVNGVATTKNAFAASNNNAALPKHTKAVSGVNDVINQNNNTLFAETNNTDKQQDKEDGTITDYADNTKENKNGVGSNDSITSPLKEIVTPLIDNQPNDNIAKLPEDKMRKLPESPVEILVAEDEIAMASVIKKEQPYKIITDAASNVVNRDISFSRDKNVDSKEYVAFSFKFGKFEFERKKGN